MAKPVKGNRAIDLEVQKAVRILKNLVDYNPRQLDRDTWMLIFTACGDMETSAIRFLLACDQQSLGRKVGYLSKGVTCQTKK
jgi:hypothetical protein